MAEDHVRLFRALASLCYRLAHRYPFCGKISPPCEILGLMALLWVVGYVQGFRSPDRLRFEQIVAVAATRGQRGVARPRLVLPIERVLRRTNAA